MQKTSVHELIHLSHKVVSVQDKLSDSALQTLDLTFSQYLILSTIRDNQQGSQQAIAEALQCTPAAVSRQINLLVTKQLIHRNEDSENRRANLLKLTVTGAALLTQAEEVLGKAFTSLLASIPHAEQQHYLQTLRALSGCMCENPDCHSK